MRHYATIVLGVLLSNLSPALAAPGSDSAKEVMRLDPAPMTKMAIELSLIHI